MLKRGVSTLPNVFMLILSTCTVDMKFSMLFLRWDILGCCGSLFWTAVMILSHVAGVAHVCCTVSQTVCSSRVVNPVRDINSAGGCVTAKGFASKVILELDHMHCLMAAWTTGSGMP